MITISKQKIVELTLSKLGIVSSILDITPEEATLALNNLDMLLATLLATGIEITYTIPDTLESSTLNDTISIEDWAIQPIVALLALALAPDFEKPITASIAGGANKAHIFLERMSVAPVNVRQLPARTVMGAGNTKFFGNFAYETTTYPTETRSLV